MAEPPALSIAVPTFRRPDMLAGCLDSLLPQLGQRTELLVIDNDPEGSARATVEARSGIRYVHEPRSGVVNARNRAVAEAEARHLAFIDDDETARPGWADALLRHVDQGVAASFGRVLPRFVAPPEPGLERLLENLYTRDLEREQDAEISDAWIHVGTGNSLFDRVRCFPTPDPFAAHLNASGGEDVWLVRSLVARGIPLHWNPAAAVEEIVPPERASIAYLKARRRRQGQQRIMLMRARGGLSGWTGAAFWMGVGGAQLALHGSRSMILKARGRPEWRSEAVRAEGGLGKLLWWQLERDRAYAGGSPEH